MKLREITAGMDILGGNASPDLEITGIYNDSRKVKPGGLFVAVSGFKENGAEYIDSAAKAGAACVIMEAPPEAATIGVMVTKEKGIALPCIIVENSRLALSKAAANFCGEPTKKLKVVGITGTNGKTTTTYLVKHIIERCTGKQVGLIGTNEIITGKRTEEAVRTTPESLELQLLFREMVESGAEYAVMEVSSHALKLGRVADVEYDVGAFTNLTQDHLDFHITMEDYFASKAKLFEMCKKGVINIDDPAGRKLAEIAKCELLTYGEKNGNAAVAAKNVRLFPDRVEFEALTDREIARIVLGIPGDFSVYNALAAVGCGLALGFELRDIASALKECTGVKGRAEVVPTGTDYTVMIDYAHTPDALENILKTVQGFAKGDVIAVFGCGGDRDATKRPIMGKTVEKFADIAVVTSDNPRTERPEAIIDDILAGMDGSIPRVVIPDRVEAICWAMDNAKPGDVVLLAGKGQETYQEINGEKYHMDEREIVRDHLAETRG